MVRTAARILFGVAVLFNTAVFASKKCKFAALSRTKYIQKYAGEFVRGGDVLSEQSTFKADQMADGRHGYLIVRDAKGNRHVVWSLQSLPPDSENPGLWYVTHLSEMNQAEHLLGKPLKVLAGGEAHLNNGVVSELNNRSGKWRGGRDRLDLAADVLGKMGLPVVMTETGPRTSLVDFSDKKISAAQKRMHHLKWEELGAKRHAYLSAPSPPQALSGQQVENALRLVHRKLYENPLYRSDTVVGHLDTGKLFPDKKMTAEELECLNWVMHTVKSIQLNEIELSVGTSMRRDPKLEKVWAGAKLLGIELPPPN